MVKVRSVQWHDEAWEVRFEIKEGVYRLEDYPVRITHLGHYEVEGFSEHVAVVATGLLRSHMRRGAVPPHAVVVNWSRVLKLTHGASQDVHEAIQRIEESRAKTLDSAVSSQF
ncbi:hypothetical protein [Sulfobacillus harzensis]|uniref:Uncharacterized protein n=1 Tax=Sulfobacillus harzensis TaxID=2729629 RepID=A0A7Y0L5A5_9FIRM|nr:hypothetical protein [Sulfobacillus harzensis]NMP22961.1 hypothetical protein [Sulfobacillus harzensis]